MLDSVDGWIWHELSTVVIEFETLSIVSFPHFFIALISVAMYSPTILFSSFLWWSVLSMHVIAFSNKISSFVSLYWHLLGLSTRLPIGLLVEQTSSWATTVHHLIWTGTFSEGKVTVMNEDTGLLWSIMLPRMKTCILLVHADYRDHQWWCRHIFSCAYRTVVDNTGGFHSLVCR